MSNLGDLREYAETKAFLADLERRPRDLSTKSASMDFPTFAGAAYGYGGGSAGGDVASWLGTYLPGAKYDYKQEAGDLWLNSAVAACLGWITDNFSEPEARVERLKGDGSTDFRRDHALVQKLADPNPDYDADALWAATVLSFVCSGDAYWIKAKSQIPGVMDLYWTPHWDMWPVWDPRDPKKFITHYVHQVNGKRVTVEKENVVHFRRGLNPVNQRVGLPQLEPVLREIVSDNAANTYQAAILRNMGVPGVLIQPEDDKVTLDEDDAKEIKRLYKEKSSQEAAGNPLMFSVRVKLQELTLSPEKLTLDKIREVPEARICAAFRLPAMVVGLSVGEKQKTYANMGVAERMAYRNCLIPLQKRFAKTVTKQLGPDFGLKPNECLRWDYSGVEAMAEEQSELTKRCVIAVKGSVMSVEEARSKLGLGPKKEGETFAPLTAGGEAKPGDPSADEEKKSAAELLLDGDPIRLRARRRSA